MHNIQVGCLEPTTCNSHQKRFRKELLVSAERTRHFICFTLEVNDIIRGDTKGNYDMKRENHFLCITKLAF